MKSLFILLVCVISTFGVVAQNAALPSHSNNPVDHLIQKLKNSTAKDIFIISHRGDWRHYPENSLQAIQSCIEMGLDMVEIDIQQTKDGHLVLMHDATIDRTTNGKGKVSDYTLVELKQFRLLSGMRRPTNQQIPTLEEAMLLVKGKIMVNLDKCYNYALPAYKILQQTGTVQQAVFKGEHPIEKVQQDLGSILDSIFFMPVVNLEKADAEKTVADYLKNPEKIVAFEFIFAKEQSLILNQLQVIKTKGVRVWVNTLWDNLCAGHTDDRAIEDLPGSYDWIIQKGFNMIQTDRPAYLLKYLQSKDLHK